MRVLHVVAGNLYGGIETILATLARERALCPDMEQHFAVCHDGRLAAELRALGAPVHVLGAARFSRPWSVLSVRRALSLVLEREGIDAVVCHSAWPLAVFGSAVRHARRTLALWLHNRAVGTHWTERLARWNRPDGVICVSRDTAATLPNLFADVRQEVIYTPLPRPPEEDLTATRAAVRAEFGTPAESVVILQASRMEEWKGQRTHLQALADLKDVPNWECWMAGGAQRPAEELYLRDLQDLRDSLGLNERVKFLGDRKDVARVMNGADIYCQPNSGPEGFSIVFLEACLARLPIVTAALGGALEIVDERTGALIPPGDHAACAQALRRLIAAPELRRRTGEAGRERVLSQCDPRGQLKKLHDFMLSLSSSGTNRESTA
jgi:glycosyltransferase involved in cell wall biosynthesis